MGQDKQNIDNAIGGVDVKKPLVSVIVPCRNEKDHIEICIRSILAQEHQYGEFELIVADGMSNDGTRQLLKRLGEKDARLRVIDNPGQVVATGLNSAIREAKGEIIIRMDAHTEYSQHYITQCLAVLQETGADNVGGPARTKSTDYMQSAICAAYHSPFSAGGARFHNVEYEGYVDTVPYGCWPREVFDRIGLFDEELVRNQDDEFNLRLTRMGGKIWQSPRIRSWYKPRGSLCALFRQYAQYGYWKVRVIQKHKLPASGRHLIPGCFALSLILLPLASVFWLPAAWLFLGVLGIYFLCGSIASCFTAAANGWHFLPVLPIVFAVYHLGYGYGFLRGIWDFIIFKRGAARTYTKLSRRTTGGKSDDL
jgi:GT2 family glycosyltransferase